jgi:hypothetical protein
MRRAILPATHADTMGGRPHFTARMAPTAGRRRALARWRRTKAAPHRPDQHQRLRDMRMFFQHAFKRELVGAVEEVTGGTVGVFVSGIDTKRDVSSEVFCLEPERG